MALVGKLLRTCGNLSNKRLPLVGWLITRNAGGGYWNKDWKPGPYPETEAQRRAAAKKYGMIYDDYEPYDPVEDDPIMFGDYPKLPIIPADQRDPYYPWDYPELKLDYGEPIHIFYDAYTHDKLSLQKEPITEQQQIRHFFIFCATFFGIIYLSWNYQKFQPIMPKQFPKDDVVHYSFEPVEK